MVAARKILCGTEVLTETPVITYRGYQEAFFDSFNRQFEALPAAVRQQIMDLHDICAHAEYKTLKGIMCTNAFQRVQGQAELDVALCLLVAHFNHSCVPNCEQSWNEQTGKASIYTTRTVLPGEELCINYINVLMPREERAKYLWQGYGFRCDCSACSVADVDSDARRSRAHDLHVQVVGASDVAGPKQKIAMVEEILNLYDAEGLDLYKHRVVQCSCAYTSSLAMADTLEARQWAELAHQYCKLVYGLRHPHTVELLQLVQPVNKTHRRRGANVGALSLVLLVTLCGVVDWWRASFHT